MLSESGRKKLFVTLSEWFRESDRERVHRLKRLALERRITALCRTQLNSDHGIVITEFDGRDLILNVLADGRLAISFDRSPVDVSFVKGF